MKNILDKILTLVLIIMLVLIIIGFISEIILNIKVKEKDNCLKINGDYYCEVRNEKIIKK